MRSHLELDNEQFCQAFAECTLDPALFDHVAHLRLAWIYLEKFDLKTAVEIITDQLKVYTSYHGARDKYNATVTIAAVKAVRHFMLKGSADSFRAFIVEYPQLINNFKELLRQHYRTDIFNSEMARQQFLEPELLPFDPE